MFTLFRHRAFTFWFAVLFLFSGLIVATLLVNDSKSNTLNPQSPIVAQITSTERIAAVRQTMQPLTAFAYYGGPTLKEAANNAAAEATTQARNERAALGNTPLALAFDKVAIDATNLANASDTKDRIPFLLSVVLTSSDNLLSAGDPAASTHLAPAQSSLQLPQ